MNWSFFRRSSSVVQEVPELSTVSARPSNDALREQVVSQLLSDPGCPTNYRALERFAQLDPQRSELGPVLAAAFSNPDHRVRRSALDYACSEPVRKSGIDIGALLYNAATTEPIDPLAQQMRNRLWETAPMSLLRLDRVRKTQQRATQHARERNLEDNPHDAIIAGLSSSDDTLRGLTASSIGSLYYHLSPRQQESAALVSIREICRPNHHSRLRGNLIGLTPRFRHLALDLSELVRPFLSSEDPVLQLEAAFAAPCLAPELHDCSVKIVLSFLDNLKLPTEAPPRSAADLDQPEEVDFIELHVERQMLSFGYQQAFTKWFGRDFDFDFSAQNIALDQVFADLESLNLRLQQITLDANEELAQIHRRMCERLDQHTLASFLQLTGLMLRNLSLPAQLQIANRLVNISTDAERPAVIRAGALAYIGHATIDLSVHARDLMPIATRNEPAHLRAAVFKSLSLMANSINPEQYDRAKALALLFGIQDASPLVCVAAEKLLNTSYAVTLPHSA